MLGGRFMAVKADGTSAAPIRRTASLTSLFQARLAETPKKPLPQEAAPAQPEIEINPAHVVG